MRASSRAQEAHRKKTQGEKNPSKTPNYPKLTNSNNGFRILLLSNERFLFLQATRSFPWFPVSSSRGPPASDTSAYADRGVDVKRARAPLASP
jgi:hypothetical protein